MGTIRTGTDLAAVEDVVAGISAHGERYLDRLFTVRERTDAGDDPERLAARFAGKEAVVKLLRPAPDQAIPLRDVAIVLDDRGAPTVELTGAAAALAESVGCGPIAVSLAHERGLAVATAVALSDR
ncbi:MULTISPECIES: holo-ACP synthase [unclassified Curtobacterium]|uniref:holo-ACP synthase n=1 Tax=Bacteria TaxID=2 RepID=UPI00104FBD5B|nr:MULTISPECIES: holo-ACP synthase [unclassified Curtobacterium]NQW88921.1 holo-ACP synthase [Curtobacterium sp. VKM Ac-2861]TCL81235.1 holo-[acyl-carrier protein] synthase [Curtobacterium sp. PhB128]TCL99360.1 holo-[acyl-carrier protein] synthase [Curtobacterium sp. PhB138]TDW45778.1 holo-[acyl-carrier protein] synthase [Curtobacterium sp. PhB42]TDW57920.1 holo-[acyl-carrier protein] synthase [Curtobacterium sp. PhB190]